MDEDEEEVAEALSSERPAAERTLQLTERIVERIIERQRPTKRRRLPQRRTGYTQKASIAGTRSICAPASMKTAPLARSSLTCTRRGLHSGQ